VREIVTFPASRYTTFLEVPNLAGSHTLCELTLEPMGPIGSSNIEVQASFWTRLLGNLVQRRPLTTWDEELASLRGGRQGRLPF
jgi:hypothetical protein